MPQKVWNPKDYDTQCVLQYNTAMIMLDSLEFQGNEKVLDIGCGTGKISAQIATQRLTGEGLVLGLDVNENMIQFAINKYKADNLHFECNDVLTMNYENYFDIAVSFWTLSWITMDEQLSALNNIIHSLNEDGKLYLMYPLKHDIYDVVSNIITDPKWLPFFSNYSMPRNFITEEQYRDEIIEHIPLDITLEKKEIECHYKDDAEMMASINCWLAHVDEIPSQEDKSQFLTDVMEAYKKHRGIEEPIIYYSILELTASKLSLQNYLRPFL